MLDGGTLSVTTHCEAQQIIVKISDSGTGLDKETAKHIFDPFFTTKPAGRGTGLGLAVCYGIVTAHDGGIEMESDRGGTSFAICLPVINENEKRQAVIDLPIEM